MRQAGNLLERRALVRWDAGKVIFGVLRRDARSAVWHVRVDAGNLLVPLFSVARVKVVVDILERQPGLVHELHDRLLVVHLHTKLALAELGGE